MTFEICRTMVGLFILVLHMAAPPSRSEMAADKEKSYQLDTNGHYRLKDNPRHIYAPGRDVCMVEEVPALNITFPLPWTHGTFCTHTTYLRRRCCDGFSTAALELGCPLVKEVVDVMTAARQFPLTKVFVQWMEKHHMQRPQMNRLFERSQGAFTLLVPIDKGFREADNMTLSELSRVVELSRGYTSPLLLYHMLSRRWYTHQLYQDQRLSTLYQGMTVAVTKLGNKMVLFNCVPVLRVDIHARDGVLHVLERPLPPSYVMSLVDLISSDPNLSMFFTILGYADLLGWLRSVNSLSVLAPTNDAFKKLPMRFLDSITYDVKYFPALLALSHNHLLQGTECSLGLRAKVKVKSLEGVTLPVSCSSSFELSIDSANVTRADVVTSNGVLHYIDKVIIPPRAMSLVQVSRRAGASHFIELVKGIGFFDNLVSFGPYTVFAPSNKALLRLNESLLVDEDSLRNLVMYHLVEGVHSSFTLIDNQALPTLLDNTFLRVKVHRRIMSAEDGLVVSGDHEAFNGYVHILDKILYPPDYSIAQVLAKSLKLKRFTSLVTQSGLALWRELSIEKGPYTLFAVPDNDVDRWASDLFTFYRIINDKRLLNRSLSAHLLDDFIMPRALEEGSYSVLRPRLRSPSHHRYPLHLRVSEGRLSLRHASVRKDFILCTNGIVLFIDSLLLP